jgi:hypothetical protein
MNMFVWVGRHGGCFSCMVFSILHYIIIVMGSEKQSGRAAMSLARLWQ